MQEAFERSSLINIFILCLSDVCRIKFYFPIIHRTSVPKILFKSSETNISLTFLMESLQHFPSICSAWRVFLTIRKQQFHFNSFNCHVILKFENIIKLNQKWSFMKKRSKLNFYRISDEFETRQNTWIVVSQHSDKSFDLTIWWVFSL